MMHFCLLCCSYTVSYRYAISTKLQMRWFAFILPPKSWQPNVSLIHYISSTRWLLVSNGCHVAQCTLTNLACPGVLYLLNTYIWKYFLGGARVSHLCMNSSKLFVLKSKNLRDDPHDVIAEKLWPGVCSTQKLSGTHQKLMFPYSKVNTVIKYSDLKI